MTSWRDNASAEAQQHLDDLLNVTLGFAQRQLEQHGEFFPYAAVIDKQGDARMIAARPEGGGESPPSADVIAACVAALMEQRQHIQATAIVADVTIPSGDAIRIDLEHAERLALTVLVPYAKRHGGGTINYDPGQVQAGPAQVWTTD